jgi:hypothetical protein
LGKKALVRVPLRYPDWQRIRTRRHQDPKVEDRLRQARLAGCPNITATLP